MKNKILPIVLLIAATTIFNSCKKESEAEPEVVTPPTSTSGAPAITSSFYFQAKIDGAWVTYQDGVGGYISGMFGGNYGSVTNQEEQGAMLINYSTGTGGFISMLKTFPGTPSSSDYLAMYGVHTYSYGINADQAGHPGGADGAVVAYTDASGVEWRSDYGLTTQTGSTFQVTEYINNTDGTSPKIVKAEFSCKLYDDAGNVKTLTNGRLRGRVMIY